ncbi:hypothetical protein PHLGIDRAFT_156803 [Phlebiopsis gigantea 11061_1 CR5-6]|uniref:Uncharacterized protein n=1 Tax=Phlebiopsis gigantea (strain 11061_1 CR5-6) TaxID=745531 RepID=A0A0C3SCQ4_PHLG1|nr:hypothetical protein PHLGIDRAFT_156803 [Phlebiopsis gigantea 11061_1 CR5-6]
MGAPIGIHRAGMRKRSRDIRWRYMSHQFDRRTSCELYVGCTLASTSAGCCDGSDPLRHASCTAAWASSDPRPSALRRNGCLLRSLIQSASWLLGTDTSLVSGKSLARRAPRRQEQNVRIHGQKQVFEPRTWSRVGVGTRSVRATERPRGRRG